jgi:hypothetical protein
MFGRKPIAVSSEFVARTRALIQLSGSLDGLFRPGLAMKEVIEQIPVAGYLSVALNTDTRMAAQFKRLVQVAAVGNACTFLHGTVPNRYLAAYLGVVTRELEAAAPGAGEQLANFVSRIGRGQREGLQPPDILGGFVLFSLVPTQPRDALLAEEGPVARQLC